MSTYTYRQRKIAESRRTNIKEFMGKPFTVKDYCDKWVSKFSGVPQDETGYKKACITEIQRITGYAPNTIKNWGTNFENAPEIVNRFCKMADILNSTSAVWSNFPE